MRSRRRPVDVDAVAAEHLEAGDPIGWFEEVYRAAGRDLAAVPWVAGRAHPHLVDWLADPVAVPPGSRAVVVGAGAGDDAAAVAAAGYRTTAIDVAPSAVRRARRRHRRAGVEWQEADLLALSDALQGAFDLVVEVHTVPWLPGVVRDAAMHAVASLAAPEGVVVAITVLATDAGHTAPRTPPWPQAPAELAAYRAGGLERVALEHADPDEDGLLEARITWRRPASG